MMERCHWCGTGGILTDYHDTEWGVPVHDEHTHFEFLCLESFQAGLNWLIMLKKREAFRSSFFDFDPVRVSRMTETDIERLMADTGIVRNRKKIEATITNAQAFLRVQEEMGSFDSYIWSFTNGKPIQNHFTDGKDIPVRTELSDTISKDLKKRGFKFLGSTTIYAHMQGIGIVNDHLTHCFRYSQVKM